MTRRERSELASRRPGEFREVERAGGCAGFALNPGSTPAEGVSKVRQSGHLVPCR